MTIARKDLDAGRVDLSDVISPRFARRPPIHPGELLRKEWLEPLGVSAYRLAKDIDVPLTRIVAILAGERSITADTALRLARYLGGDAQSWINLQTRYDLATAERRLKTALAAIKRRAA